MSIVFPPKTVAASSSSSTTAAANMKKKKRDYLIYNHHSSFGSHVIGHATAVVRHLLYLLHRRRQFFPFVYVACTCLLLFFTAFSLFSTPPTPSSSFYGRHHRHYLLDRSRLSSLVDADSDQKKLFQIPLVDADSDRKNLFHVPKNGGNLNRDLWKNNNSNLYHGCSNPIGYFADAKVKTNLNRYLLIATSGGLNQQRTGITDAVVAAYILNATLVIPNLDHDSYWKDKSDFADIFDVNLFISILERDVTIIKKLPVMETGEELIPYNMRIPRKCDLNCYHEKVLPALVKKNAVQLTKFDYRLSNKLDVNLQRLRCKANYHALKFTDPILQLGRILVDRMRKNSNKYIALHLRFEPDMLAFSGCYYGGGDYERTEFAAIRKRWKNLHLRSPENLRAQGKCPLSPEEIGLMLRALGYGSDVHLYIASGEIYGGEQTLAPLKAMFPHIHSKETLATEAELKPFSSFSSRMAALDFIVCDQSDVFATNNNGNMARMLAGQRRYFGHKPTIRPSGRKLANLLMDRNNMTWEDFSSKLRKCQVGFMGEPDETKPDKGVFHENPSACICKQSGANQRNQFDQHSNDNNNEDGDEFVDIDYFDNTLLLPGKDLPTESYLDRKSLRKQDLSLDLEFSSHR